MGVAARARCLGGPEPIEDVAPEFVRRGAIGGQNRLGLSAVPGDVLFGPGDEQVVLVLEVKVDRADGDAGVLGDFLHGGLLESVMAKALAGRLENPLPLVVHRPPPQARFRKRLTARLGRSTNVMSISISLSSAGRK